MKMLLKFWPVLLPLIYYVFLRLKNKKMKDTEKRRLLKKALIWTIFFGVIWLIIYTVMTEKEGFTDYNVPSINKPK